jgi:hypothetical protein
MKKILLTITTLILLSFFAKGQTAIEYKYDDAGNRTDQRLVTLNIMASVAPGNFNTPPRLDELDKSEAFVEDFREREIAIYPNPTRGQLAISINGEDFDTECTAQLFSVTGKKLQELKVNMNTITPVDMRSYTTGLYLLVLIFEDEKLSYKIIKK